MKHYKRLVFLLVTATCFSLQTFSQNKPFAKVKLKRTPTADSIKMARDSVLERLKGSHKDEGLFTLYQDTLSGSILLYVKKSQLGKENEAGPEFIYQSFSMGGPASLFLNQNMIRETWVFSIRKKFEKLEFVRANTNFYYDPENKLSKAANVDVADAVFFTDKIAFKDSAGYFINADGLFLSDKLDRVKPIFPPSVPATAFFNLGQLTPAKSTYRKVRSFPNNTDVVVELAYDNPAPMNEGGRDITDARYVTVKMQHSFLEMPKNDYRPRRDDPRVGYFTQEVNDMTTTHFLNYRDLINRWHLKKKTPGAALSEPVEPIVFWVENTAPVELRQIVLDAGHRWNEAFEKAGFKNAIVMKMMPDDATWDPADIRYNVIRFVSSDLGYAIGPSFVNPRTGQILGADITIDYGSFIRGTLEDDELYNGMTAGMETAPVSPGTKSSRHWMNCTIANGLRAQYGMAKTALEILDNAPGQKDSLFRQFFAELVLHEMGHTLGLNHNMKASQMLSPDELTEKQKTGEYGVMGSVMDYSATNVSLNQEKQAHFYTVKPGPYDHWAIEYGYTPFVNDEEAGLTKILSRSTDPKLTFGNDADIASFGSGIDPRVMVWDMSNDMVRYGSDRFQLVNNLMGKMKERFAQPGQSYQNLVSKYYTLAYQRFAMASALSRYIGGIYVDRTFVGQTTDKQPYTPVPADYQKKALQALNTYIFSPNAFAADTYLFPYLQRQRRGFNFFGSPEDPKPERFVAAIQSNVLGYLMFPATLQRINSSTLYGNSYAAADVMKDLSAVLFDEDLKSDVNLYRQNIQTEYVKKLVSIMNGTDYDNASKAAAYNTLGVIKGKLEGSMSHGNEQSRAHKAALRFMIDKARAIK